MKLGQAIDAGYRIVKLEGHAVRSQSVNLDYGVVSCTIEDRVVNSFVGGSPPQVHPIALSLDREVSSLNIKLRMFVDFNEETAQALLIGDVAPLMKEDVVTYKPTFNKSGRAMANSAYGSASVAELSKLLTDL